jgi:hypothetical protein
MRRAVTVGIGEIADRPPARDVAHGRPDIAVSVDTDGAFSFRPHSAAANDFRAGQFNLIGERNLIEADLDRITGLARERGYAVLSYVTFS